MQKSRRNLLKGVVATATGLTATSVSAFHTDTHFDDTVKHKLVYQLNKADIDYIGAILFSAGEMIRTYGDDIHIIIEVFGPGIHLLAKKPRRPVPLKHQQSAKSLSFYGVSFHACNNTLKSLKWNKNDLAKFSKIVESGAQDLMLLQEKGYKYISW
jgi:uncharacterized protein